MKDKLTPLILAGFTALHPLATEGKEERGAIDPKTANPAAISRLLRPANDEQTEALAATIRTRSGFVSEMRRPENGSGISYTAIQAVVKHLFSRTEGSPISPTLWLAHNHSAPVMLDFWERNGFDASLMTHPDRALNGPSLLDCAGELVVTKATWLKAEKKVKILNEIIEPGGIWLCSSLRDTFDEATEDKYTEARRALLVASQSRDGASPSDIRHFQEAAARLLGIQMIFLPHGRPQSEFEIAEKKLLETDH